jgi:hypothetical protein
MYHIHTLKEKVLRIIDVSGTEFVYQKYLELFFYTVFGYYVFGYYVFGIILFGMILLSLCSTAIIRNVFF